MWSLLSGSGERKGAVKSMRIDRHADDYAISHHSSSDILQCLKAGKLDSISVLTNMSCYEEEAGRLLDCWETLPVQPQLTIHLNFMEGHCLAPREEVRWLTDEKGYFNIGWGTLFQWNYLPWKYGEAKAQLKREIKAQTERFIAVFGKGEGLRFDGHQHTQMIPLVYRALLEVIAEEGYPVSYIRVTKEPVLAYWSVPSLYRSYSPVNWVKNAVLNVYAPGMERRLRNSRRVLAENRAGEEPMLLWGVVMSGHMDAGRVARLMPAMQACAEKKGRTLEVLFHPGTVRKEELTAEFCNAGANEFHIAEGRRIEWQAVMGEQA